MWAEAPGLWGQQSLHSCSRCSPASLLSHARLWGKLKGKTEGRGASGEYGCTVVVLNYCPFVLPVPSRAVLGMPDMVEDMCPDIPQLEGLMKEINDLAQSGARYTEMPHVIEVILPMLCNYLSYWWEQGPEHLPPDTGPWCTKVTSEHLSVILGNILKIINNNLGIDEASWMKRIAGTTNAFLPSPRFRGQGA